LRAKFRCPFGVTNVWTVPPVNGTERVKRGGAAVHANQKPLELTALLLRVSSDPGDVVWEPFGGMCTTAIAARRTGRRCFSAEILPGFYALARQRLLADSIPAP
jgi:site-specific DNA-methyltransferase (adenine-specific)